MRQSQRQLQHPSKIQLGEKIVAGGKYIIQLIKYEFNYVYSVPKVPIFLSNIFPFDSK